MPTRFGQPVPLDEACPHCDAPNLRLRLLATDDPQRGDLVRECGVCRENVHLGDVTLVPEDERREVTAICTMALEILGLNPAGPLSDDEIARMERVRAEHLPGSPRYCPDRDRYWMHAPLVSLLMVLARKPIGAQGALTRCGGSRTLGLMIKDLA